MDAHYSKSAEDCLYSELAFAIGKEKSEMRQLIADTIKKNVNIRMSESETVRWRE